VEGKGKKWEEECKYDHSMHVWNYNETPYYVPLTYTIFKKIKKL
jgi:hypothetical protein